MFLALVIFIKEVSPETSGTKAWAKWIELTSNLDIDPFLETFDDMVPFLKIFMG